MSSKITPELKYELISLAPALTIDECAEYLDIDFAALSPEDKAFFKKMYMQAKYQLRVEAINALKNEMKNGKDRFKPSLAVLLRFADEWETLSVEDKQANFTANINLSGGS